MSGSTQEEPRHRSTIRFIRGHKAPASILGEQSLDVATHQAHGLDHTNGCSLNPAVVPAHLRAPEAPATPRYTTDRRSTSRDVLRAFRAAIEPLRRTIPFMYQIVVGEARRALLRRFPYSAFYEVHGSDVVILACFHEARDPEEWQHRITSQSEEDRP